MGAAWQARPACGNICDPPLSLRPTGRGIHGASLIKFYLHNPAAGDDMCSQSSQPGSPKPTAQPGSGFGTSTRVSVKLPSHDAIDAKQEKRGRWAQTLETSDNIHHRFKSAAGALL